MYPYINDGNEKPIQASELKTSHSRPLSSRIAQLLLEAITEEEGCVQYYEELSQKEENALCAKLYMSAANDDRHHIKSLEEMYKGLTGLDAPKKGELGFEAPSDAVLNEFENARFYRDLAAVSDDHALKEMLCAIMNDKQNHAFLNIYICMLHIK
jgi:rubrerythrin